MPTQIDIDWSQFQTFNKKLGKFIPVKLEAALTDYGLYLEKIIVDEIDRMDLSVSGEMKKSVTHIVRERLQGWLVWVGTNVRTAGGYPYAVGVHEGTCPHWAPIEPLIEWVKKKGMAATQFSIKTHGRTGGKKQRAGEDLAMAYRIQSKIAREGTEPHPFMTNVFTKERHKIRKEIGMALFRKMKGGKVV
jgi:hypothetical protein